MTIDQETIRQGEIVRCVVCGADKEPEPALDGLLSGCVSCGFLWTADRLPPPEQLYDEAYYQTDGYRAYFDEARQRRFESARRLRWLMSRVRPASLVEAGSAGGFFVEAARRAGVDASGVEVSEVASRFARERLGVPVVRGCFESFVAARPVDVVCAFHVLEHVEDPRAFLGAAREALVPGGWLALEVPNIASAGARRLGTAWPAIAPAYHRWHFSPVTLRQILEDCGFRMCGHDTVFSRFYWRALPRWAHARELFIADTAASRSPSVRHPWLGDLLRVFARRDDDAKGGAR
ncbi:methyltransferase domain-containing protein [Rugosimonospora acidiphila]|uniref:Methyltransferase domain-containing protein n=1 Tax=Rugosimonospora acidiphila TaxID=556531 RepID=A0ABP9SG30_9ACTN